MLEYNISRQANCEQSMNINYLYIDVVYHNHKGGDYPEGA